MSLPGVCVYVPLLEGGYLDVFKLRSSLVNVQDVMRQGQNCGQFALSPFPKGLKGGAGHPEARVLLT